MLYMKIKYRNKHDFNSCKDSQQTTIGGRYGQILLNSVVESSLQDVIVINLSELLAKC